MIADILYRCPICGIFDWFRDNRCISCNASVIIHSRTDISVNDKRFPISYWYAKVLEFSLPEPVDGIIMKSGAVNLSLEAKNDIYKGYAGISASRFTKKQIDSGFIRLGNESVEFSGKTLERAIPINDITSLTIESNTLIITTRDLGVMFFDFLEESGKKWEDCIRKALIRFHSDREILEFYPRLIFAEDFRTRPVRSKGHQRLQVPVNRWYRKDHSTIFSILRMIARPLIKTMFSVKITGLDHIPLHGPAILLINHTSFLDAIVLGTFTKRNIWFMAKNSEYKGIILNWFLKIARAFPVRRYTNDVQAVRNAIRIVQQGHILGIFPEGERTWDNTALPLRTGTIRLVLALGKPVIPVGISGAYELMPRWTSSIVRSPVSIRIGKPLHIDHIPIPAQGADDISRASNMIKEHIIDLIEEKN